MVKYSFVLAFTVFLLIGCGMAAGQTYAKVAPYHGVLTTDYRYYGDSSGWDSFSGGNATRFMQSGTLQYFNANLSNMATITEFKIKIWRLNPATGKYNLISTSADISSRLSDGYNSVYIGDLGISVIEGDSYDIFLKGTGGWGAFTLASSPSDDYVHAYVGFAQSPNGTEYDWDNTPYKGVYSLSVQFLMDSPDVIFIGDSILSGAMLSYAFTDQSVYAYTQIPSPDVSKSVPYKFNALSGMTYQNLGIGGDTYPHLYNRLSLDVLQKSPDYVVIEGGVNNLGQSDTADYIFPYIQDEIEDCIAAGATPIVLLVFPDNWLTSAQNAECNDLNQMIIDYHEANQNFILVDCREALGTYTNGVWTIDAQYNSDGVHLTEAGNDVVAQAIYTEYMQYEFGPVAAFTQDATLSGAPMSVEFTDQSTRTPTSWAWNFGDGETSTSQSPTHVYDAVGVYTVRLTATNANGSSTKTRVGLIHVISKPGTSFTWGRPGEFTYTFVDQTTNTPVAWYWQFGDGETSIEQNPTHTFPGYGAYNVNLTTSSIAGSNHTVIELNIFTKSTDLISPVGETWQHVAYNESREFSFTTPYGVLTSHWFIDGNEVNYTGLNLSYTFANPGRASNISVWAETTQGNSSMIEYRTMTGREIATGHVVPFNDTNYNNLMNGTLDMDTDKIMSSIFAPLTDSMGRMAYVILFVLPFVFIWLQTGKMTIVTTLSLITGALFIGFIPSQFVAFISIAIVLSFASAFYKLSRGP